jgi:3-oxoacyl-[acyl-carrier-protein] synthase II
MSSASLNDVLITGLGVVSPIGNSRDEIWASLESRRSGVRRIERYANAGWMAPFGGAVTDFDAKSFVTPRKSLKVMCRQMQFAAAASEMAWEDAGLGDSEVDPERAGVVAAASGYQFCDLEELRDFYRAWVAEQPLDINRMPRKSIEQLFPLWMLKYLPNLNACHVGIRRDLRGPTNTVSISDTSSLLAFAEAADVIRRGAADVMLCGGSGSYLEDTRLAFHAGARLSCNGDDPTRACRPFDRERTGMVYGEGAAFFVLESRAHATRRGARSLARVAGEGRRSEPSAYHLQPTGKAIGRALVAALDMAGVEPGDVGHVNAHGISTLEDDPIEARAIQETLGDVPVTAPKSFFGSLLASGGAVEIAVSLIGLDHGVVPPTLNYETPDDACPVNVVTNSLPTANRTFVALNHAATGQAAAVVFTEG